MIDQARIADRLKTRFRGVTEVRPGVLRASEKYEDREYAVWYFDLTSNVADTASHIREYQEELLADTFFSPESPSDLRWNHYLYFVADDEEAKTLAFHDAKVLIEADRTYARKAVFTEKELDLFFSATEKEPATPPADISSQWTQQLDLLGLSYILDDTVTAPEAARLIKAGQTQPSSPSSALAPLPEAEMAAGNRFLKSLSITGFRKCPSTKYFDFSNVNLIFGRNGTGKTSLLEAIEYLYCGENRRHADIIQGTKVVGEFFGSTASLITSSSLTKPAILRARNAYWYAKADVKKSTLKNSFGKFNFLDTDAAVDLSNNNDSEDRLKSDVARLLLGPEAEKLATKLARVGEKVAIEIRDSERAKEDFNRQLNEARERVDDIRTAPQNSDALFNNLRDALLKCNWKNIPETKQEATTISDSLRCSIVSIRQLSHASSNYKRDDSGSLIVRHASLVKSLAEAEDILVRIKNLMHLHNTENYSEKNLLSQKLSVETLLRYSSVGFNDMFTNLATLKDRVNSSSKRLAALGNASVDIVGIFEADKLLTEVLTTSEEAVHRLEIAVEDQSAAVKAIESTMASVNVLKQRLFSTAKELLTKLPDPECCPVCRTQFEAGQLKLQMDIAAKDGGSELLAEAQTKHNETASKLAQAKSIQVAYEALVVFVSPQSNLTVKQALRIVEETNSSVEQDRRGIEALERMIAQLASDGLTEVDLRKHLGVLGLDSMPKAKQLVSIQEDCIKALSEYTKLNQLREKEIAALRQRIIDLAGFPLLSLDESPEELVQQMRVRIADLNLLISAYKQLESVLDRFSVGDPPLELLLEQASDQCSSLAAAIQSEAHANSSILTEMNKIVALDAALSTNNEQLARMRSASGLIEELLQQAKAGVFSDQVMEANAASISAIFSAIQAPNEFVVKADNEGALRIFREDTNESVELQQMSTGQRAAYALSLFLSMNNSLISGPPLILLDDPIAHVDDLNILSFLDYLREIVVRGTRQIFLATADDKLAGLFRQKFRFMGTEKFREISLSR